MTLDRKYLIHPSFVILGLLMLAITSLFLSFSFAYIYTRVEHHIAPVRLPFLFFINAVVLILSGLCLTKAKAMYRVDNTKAYQSFLFFAFALSLVFMVSQIFAWREMMADHLFVSYSNLTAYIYLLSGVHLLHVLVGVPFLLYFYLSSKKYMKDPITVFLYFSDNAKLRKLNLISIYWHFLEILWIYLMLFFLINQFIS